MSDKVRLMIFKKKFFPSQDVAIIWKNSQIGEFGDIWMIWWIFLVYELNNMLQIYMKVLYYKIFFNSLPQGPKK